MKSNRTKQDQTGPNRTKLAQMSPDGPKWGQTGWDQSNIIPYSLSLTAYRLSLTPYPLSHIFYPLSSFLNSYPLFLIPYQLTHRHAKCREPGNLVPKQFLSEIQTFFRNQRFNGINLKTCCGFVKRTGPNKCQNHYIFTWNTIMFTLINLHLANLSN